MQFTINIKIGIIFFQFLRKILRMLSKMYFSIVKTFSFSLKYNSQSVSSVTQSCSTLCNPMN